MKGSLSLILIVQHVLLSTASFVSRSLRSPISKSSALIAEKQNNEHDKLIPGIAKQQWAHRTHKQRTHLLVREQPDPAEAKPVAGCTACFGVQVVYGKYQSESGDQADNSFYLFKAPEHKKTTGPLPVIIHFHPGGFFSGSPWKKENAEIKEYLRNGFAVVSVGYRLVTEKYFYESKDGSNKTEELIKVDDEGKLSLDERSTMEEYKVRIGKQEFITKYLYDATQMMENLIENKDKFGLDIDRIVFVGESTGGAAIHYLTWLYHKWNVGRFTPKGMILNNAQLDYPVHNMLDQTWDLFVETMGAHVKLSEVVSPEACPIVIGNHMCGSPLGEVSDYELCNHVWNKKALQRFCGEALKSATLGEVKKQQVWPKADKEVGKGMEKLWYASKNMQKHLPSDPFYMYVANSMNGTDAVSVAHHSIFALNFAKYAEMGKQGSIHYTIYYSDFAHMTEADRGMKRFEISAPPGDLDNLKDLELPPAASVTVASHSSAALYAPGPAPAPGPSASAPGPAPAPAPVPEVVVGKTVYNYLSTHGWREDDVGRDAEPASSEERILYACLAAGTGPFQEFHVKNDTVVEEESGSTQTSLSTLGFALVAFTAFFSGSC